MARITVEDCLKNVDNRFELIHLSAKRVRQLRKGSEPLVQSKNTDVVVSLREIAAGEVFQIDEEEAQRLLIESKEAETKAADSQEIPEQAAEEAPIIESKEENNEAADSQEIPEQAAEEAPNEEEDTQEDTAVKE